MNKKLNTLSKYLISTGLSKEARDISELIKQANKVGAIKRLGFPDLLAHTFQDIFGKNSFILARWFASHYKGRRSDRDHWLSYINDGRLYMLSLLYDAIKKKDIDLYIKILKEYELSIPENINDEYLDSMKDILKNEIKKVLKKDYFFSFNLTNDILAGKVKNLAPYKKLDFKDAIVKYNEKQIFNDVDPIIEFQDGYKWIDVGKRSYLIGKLMRNCGSCGVMSWDENKTMMVLFDKENKPHVVATYSPGENRLSGIEGVAGSMIKDKYADYLIPLQEKLGAKVDIHKSKSKMLALKVAFLDQIKEIKRLAEVQTYDNFFYIKFSDGKEYISDFYSFVPWEVFLSFIEEVNKEENKELYNKLYISKSKTMHDYAKAFFNNNNDRVLDQLGFEGNSLSSESLNSMLRKYNSRHAV